MSTAAPPPDAPSAAGRAASGVAGTVTGEVGFARFIPDPFVLTLGLVVVVAVVALALTDIGIVGVARAFSAGLLVPGQLAFGFQMALVLMTGTAIAAAPVVARTLARLAGIPGDTVSGAVVVGAVAMGAALLNWGLGLVVGAVVARAVGRSLQARGHPVAWGVLGAAGYCSIAVWHGGLSGSAPLKVATASAAFGPAIPIAHTLGSTRNLVVTAGLVVAYLLTLAWCARRPGAARVPAPPTLDDVVTDDRGTPAPRAGLPTLALGSIVVVALAAVLVEQLVDKGAAAITLDWFIAACVVMGLIAHGRAGPLSWARAMGRGAGDAGGVLLHFPFYFGVVAVAVDSGLVGVVAAACVDVARALPLSLPGALAWTTFIAAGLINLAVPSGGGQWAVQGPLIAATARAVDVDVAPLVMAFAWGDQLTNLLQPFWALPVLAITGLRPRDLLPTTALLCGVGFVVTTLGLLLLT
jgi:short-chain fatty acids transporter